MADSLRGAVAALPRPELGAVAGRPENMTSQERDAEAFQATAGEFRKGARSAANSLGATVVGLAGAIGDSVGADEFAARRWAEAEDFLSMADAVGPRVRDYRTVKDFSDTMDLVTGMAGQASVFMAPALAGGGGAALAGAGLRGAVATGAAASFVPESGEQALRTRDSPGTPAEKLGLSLGKGAVNAAIDVLPIGAAFSTIRKASKGVKGAGRAVSTIPALTAGEAVTEGVQEKVGQIAEGLLDPDRDTSEDTPEMINAALQGAVGGGGLGIGTAAASKLASITSVDSAKELLRVRDRVEDPDDFSGVPSDISEIPAWLDARVDDVARGLKRVFERDPKKYAKYEGFEEDPDLQRAFAAEVRKDFTDTVDTPAAQKRLIGFKKFVAGLEQDENPDHSKDLTDTADSPAAQKRTAELKKFVAAGLHRRGEVRGLALQHMQEAGWNRDWPFVPADLLNADFRRHIENDPEISDAEKKAIFDAGRKLGVVPSEPAKKSRIRTSIDLAVFDNMKKHLAPTSAGLSSTEQLALGDALKGFVLHSFGRRETIGVPEARAGETRPVKMPDQLVEEFGDQLPALLSSTFDILKKGGAKMVNKPNFKAGLAKMTKAAKAKLSGLEELVLGAIVDDASIDPHTRSFVAETMTSRIREQMKNPNLDRAQFLEDMRTAFGPRATEVLDAFETERERLTRGFENFGDLETPPGELGGQQDPTADDRLKRAYKEGPELEQGLRTLRDAYGDKDVQFRVEPELEERDGVLHMTGRQFIRAETPDVKVGFTPEELENVKEHHRKAGVENSVVTMEIGEFDADGDPVMGKNGNQVRKKVAISIPNLMAQVQSDFKFEGKKEGAGYARAVFMEGISRLASMEGVLGFAESSPEGLKFPDDMFIGNISKKPYTFGEIMSLEREGPAEERAAEFEEAERKLLKRLAAAQKRGPLREGSLMEEFAQLRVAAGFVDDTTLTPKAEIDATRRILGPRGSSSIENEQRYIQFVEESEKLAQERREGLTAGKVVGEGVVELADGKVVPKRVVQDKPRETAETRDEISTEGGVPFATGNEFQLGELEEFQVEKERSTAEKEHNVDELTGESTTGLPTRGPTGQLATGLREEEKAGTNGVVFTRDPERIARMGGAMASSNAAKGLVFIDMEGARAEVEAGFPYFLGKTKIATALDAYKAHFTRLEVSETSKQKSKVAKRLGLTKTRLKKMFPTTKDFVAFLVRHERSHINHNDVAGYPRKDDGTLDLMHPAAILIETRATFEALPVAPIPKASRVGLGASVSTPEEQATVRRYVEHVLGTERTELLFKEMEDAGGFANLNGVEALAISIHALDPLSVGFHEAAHALVARLRAHDQRAANVLLNAANSPLIQTKLRELLKDEPGALEQMADPEERVAYMYQFWAVDKLTVGPETNTIFQKIKTFLRVLARSVLGVGDNPTEMLQAELIFRAFHNGELAQRGAVAEVMSRIVPRDRATQGALGRVGDITGSLLATADGYIRDFNIPAMTRIADQMFNPAEGGSGMMQTRHIKRNQFMNRVNDALTKLGDSESEARVLKALQTGKLNFPARPAEARAVGEIRKVLDDIFKYMQDSKVKVVEAKGEKGKYTEHELKAVKDFFPRAYDREYITANERAFRDMLRKNLKISNREAVTIMERLLGGTKAEPKESDFTAGLTFYAPNTMARKLNIPESELEPFLQKDLRSIMYNYVAYTVRRAEYARRFGNQGQQIAEETEKAKSEGASTEQIKSFTRYVRAMEGSLGDEMNANLRGVMGAVLTYQNIRLLPLALFSSLVDPNGIALRSGDWKQAPKAFVRGLRELVSDLPDADRDFAKLVGAVSSAGDQHMVADMYGANYSGRWQKWLNEKLFKLNGMESWNNSMRVVAANAGREFIIRHATKPNKHSERYLRELGLEKDDVQFTDRPVLGRQGELVYDAPELDLTPQMVDAINKFVDGAVLRPHAGIRPIWMSDPHFMLITHLKQFTFSFQTTIVKRTVHEAMHGNYTPLLVLSSYVPFILASDIMRAMVTPGGADDDRLNRYDAQDWLFHGVKRAGIVGPGEYGANAGSDLAKGNVISAIAGLAGPTAEQLVDILGAEGRGDLARQFGRAIPGVPSLALRR